ncbi:MAG TPA: cytochrome o ubiquinol oxidase subunit IV [Candidatus Saccharimonadales bacterium]|nr:cytochrome o ubiquinol oxidase subunit IV [Candidatus Saccharimonadales bacterium]
MINNQSSVKPRNYYIGFGLSLLLTLTAYLLVWRHAQSHHAVFTDSSLRIGVIVLALLQLIVQLIFFLHLNFKQNLRWNLTVLSFAAIVVLILVIGSIWIMTNLNYSHAGYGKTHDGHTLTSPSQTNQYIIQDEGVQP